MTTTQPRRSPLQWIHVCLLSLAIGGAVCVAQPEPESKTYLGKPLNYWVTQTTATERSENLDRVVDALSLAVGSSDFSTQVAAADALAILGPEARAAVPRLLAQLGHEQPWVRSGVSGALVAIGAEAVPALTALFREQNGARSVGAAFILGTIGEAAKPAIPAILNVMKAQPPAMRSRYAEILNQIDPVTYPGNVTHGTQPSEQIQLHANDPIAGVADAMASDWPQFHGPRRDSVCRETGLLKEWPEAGPELLWTLEGLGRGFSSVSIAGSRLLTMGDRPDGTGGEAQFVLAYDLQSREPLWATRVGVAFTTGPRSTPTIDGDRVYALGTEGDLVCLDTGSGRLLWSRNLPADFGGQVMSGWKFCESPLVDGDRLICTPGGAEATMVALHKMTGELLWQCAVPAQGEKGADGAGYSSAMLAEIDGVRQYVQLIGRGVVGVEAGTGRFLWGYNRIAGNIANITAPIVRGNHVFVSTAYNTGSALLEIVRDGDQFAARETYFLGPRDFQNHHGGVVWVGNHVYGSHGTNGGKPTCIDVSTGEICWSEKAVGRGSACVLYVDGHLIFRYDRGEVALVEASAEQFQLKGKFSAVTGDGPAWAHPVVHGGKLYLRHGNLLACYDLRDSQ